MDPHVFDRMVPHLKGCGMDAAAITRARERWEDAWDDDMRGWPCPFCSGRGRTGWAQAGFADDSREAFETMKCKSCGETIPLRKP
jgi:hypothetical protein